MKIFSYTFDAFAFLGFISIVTGIYLLLALFIPFLKTNRIYKSVKSSFNFCSIFVFVTMFFGVFFIPSGSMEPTFLVGDNVLVNKFKTGLRFPLGNTLLIKGYEPKRGEILVFKYKMDKALYVVKRIVGVPGDEVKITNKDSIQTVYINGEEVKKHRLNKTFTGSGEKVVKFKQSFYGHDHEIFLSEANDDNLDITVPPGEFFVMGDNRPNSSDSRFWGFVSSESIVGTPVLITLSWDLRKFGFRMNRFFKFIQ